ncbi:MAG TPA: hypothetical protein VIF15_06335 [Polyangiaceae bacterium]|jgi:hypothetical protein
MKPRRALPSLIVLAGAWMSSSCAPSGFANPQDVQTVRILASQADQPYAAPGATVKLEVLAYDGRASKPEPMTISWLPLVCENPTNDAYYACFQQIAGGGQGDAGAGADGGAGGGAGLLQPGVNLTPLLPGGPSFQFKMPDDVVTSHPPVPGAPVPYGITILFNIACAGHLEIVPVDPGSNNPVKVPLGCFDQDENQLGADDWVLGFTRVYAYAPDSGVTNTNPVIDHVDVEGQTVDLAQGYTTTRCTADRRDSCPHVHIGPVVPASSQEVNPEAKDIDGNPLHEEIWADFYATFGQFTDDARLLYQASSTGPLGSPHDTDDQFLPPNDPGEGLIWIIVRDNRGGAAWVTVPVHVQ